MTTKLSENPRHNGHIVVNKTLCWLLLVYFYEMLIS